MPTISPANKVLVSGANGFLAAWVVHTLLERGYSVRGTVRSADKGVYLVKLFEEKFPGKFEVVEVKDITADGAFDEAVKGVQGVLHVASPIAVTVPGADPEDMIRPAVDGTVGILKSVRNFGTEVKRVVVTSSTSTLLRSLDTTDPYILDESSWNTTSVEAVQKDGPNTFGMLKYFASKVLAERAAWDFYAKHKDSIDWDITTLIPPYIVGPFMHDTPTLQSAHRGMRVFYERTFLPNTYDNQADLATIPKGTSYADVRDAALAHVLALEKPDAGGERIIISNGEFIWQDWLDVIHEMKSTPLDEVRKSLIPVGTKAEGKTYTHSISFDTDKGKKILGIKYMTMEETVEGIINDFVARGW